MIRAFVLSTLLCVSTLLLSPAQTSAADDKADAGKGKFEVRVSRVGGGFKSVRFNARTGEAWILDNDKFVKITEGDAAPTPGEYDCILFGDDANWSVLRLDHATGGTWQMRGGRWEKIKEPGAK